jgi:diguanylate cyclase (GGDEF)-like protein/PAS domain S-box-containing protein
MLKQFPTIRALRCAAIAVPLAAGLEPFRQPIVHNCSALSTRMRAIKATAATGCIMFVFEVAKQALYPRTSVWTSHAVTILFTMVTAALVTFAVLKKEAEDALRQSGAEYRLLFDSNPLPMWVFERKTLKFLAVNEAASRQYGFSSREFLSMTIADITPEEDDLPPLSEATAKPIHGIQEATIGRHRKKNGALIDVEIAGHDLYFHGIEAELIAVRDVTERKKAEETVQRLATIVESSEDAIIGQNTEGVISSWNRAAERMYGYTSTEVIGRDLSLLLPAERQAEVQVIVERIQNGLPVNALETQRITKGGSVLDVSVSISPIKGGTGRITGASTIARDITQRKRGEEQLKLQSAALEAAANAIVITDSHGAILWVNGAFTTMTGYGKEEVLGKNPRLLKSGKQPESFYAVLWSTISSGKVWQGELVNRRKDGTTYTEEMTITPVTRDVSNPANRYFIAIKQDITERKQIEQALRQAEENYRAIFEDAVIGIFQSTPGGRYINVNPAMAHMLGYESPHELVASITDISQQVYADPTCREEFKRLLTEQGMVKNFECAVYRKDGGKVWISANVRAVSKDGVLVGYEGTNEDITARKVAEERVQFLAYYDALTGLPNRTLFGDRLAKALAGARRQEYRVAILFLDLDRFKDINDSLGHSVGDLLLQEVAERLKTWGRDEDTIARLGGDEFLIMLTDVRDVPDAAVTAQRLIDAMAGEFVVQGHSRKVSCSIGISIFPEHGADGETLISRADAAMYSAKDYGRNNFRFFTEDMNAQAVERLILENSLRLALEEEELFLVYQPQMHTGTGRITGLEALLRWQHPDLGLVPPDKFIRIAENSGLILPIGEWVLRTACSQARKWQDEGLPAVTVAVNVSAIQFRQKNFCELIRKILHETGLAPQYLELELTESLLLSNADLMLSVVQELTAMGLTLAIDDFGTGYSSFAYLRHFRVSKIKIDRVFIRDVAVNPDDAAITTAIISMAKSLRLKVIAEGVENEAQLSFLRAHHCDEIQGYYFSKPLAVDKVADKLRGDSPEPHDERKPAGDNPDTKPYEVRISLMSIGLALLMSADPVTIQQFSLALRELSISPDACQDAASAGLLLKQRKFDAVIVDLQLGEQSGLVLDEVRLSSSNRTAVTFSISDDDAEVTAAFRKKSQFVFERPLSAQSIHKTLKPAYGLILRERRRYFRYPVSIPVIIRRASMQDVWCNSVNISEGGMALSTVLPLVAGESVRVQFALPDHEATCSADSTICWGKTGQLGIRFVSISDEHSSHLQVWLSQKLEETLPEFVAGQFQQAEL